MAEDKRTVVHLKKKHGDKECCRCNTTLTDDGVYTYNEEVYKTPPPGYRNCRAMWSE